MVWNCDSTSVKIKCFTYSLFSFFSQCARVDVMLLKTVDIAVSVPQKKTLPFRSVLLESKFPFTNHSKALRRHFLF